jgi:hypothetical protein
VEKWPVKGAVAENHFSWGFDMPLSKKCAFKYAFAFLKDS